MRFIKLTEEELNVVEKLYKTSENSVERERCMFLKLSAQKRSIMEITRIMGVKRLKISRFFDAWEKAHGLEEKKKTLRIKKGRGAKLKLEKVQDIVPSLVKEHHRNLNVVLNILEKEYHIHISKNTLKTFLK
jgi:transposase